jgi:autotransporter-associated beta strand protein
LEAAAGVLKDAGKTVATVSNVDAIITATASAYAANGSNQVELMLVAHGEEIVDKLGEHLGYGIRIGNQVITTCEGVEGGISAEEFQTNIDKFVNSIHLYCCNVGQDTNLMNALSSIWFVTAFTNKVQADRTGTLQTNADRTVTRIKGFTIPEGATELALLNPGVYPINLNWTNLLGGLWSNPTNWSCDPGFVKNSTNVFYDPGFIVCLTNDMTTTIDLWLAVRRLCFSDRSCRHVFFINPGSGGGLILGATNGSPAIFVYGPTTTTINAPVAASDGFLKCGSGTLTLGASNSITGPLIVKFGTLRVGNPSALGTTNNSVFIADGATLDVNGINLGAEPITVSGAGVDGHGGIVNNGATQINALQCVTLAGDTTFGGTNRWDIRSASSTNAAATLSTGGNACNLTKTDGNQVSLAGVQVDAGLGDINLLRGILSLEGLSLPTSFLEVVEVV